MTPAATRGIVFDLDDTLVWERDYVRSGFRAVDAALVPLGLVPGAAFGRLWADFEAGARGDQFNRLLAAFPDAAVSVADLVDVYRTHTPDLALDAERRALLAALRPGHRLGVITDGPLASQTAKAACIGLAALVDAVVFSDAWGHAAWKPSPRPYPEAARALGLAPAALTYVGDNPAKDFVTARALGWQTVRLRHPAQLRHAAEPPDDAHAADHDVTSVRDLAALLGVPAPPDATPAGGPAL